MGEGERVREGERRESVKEEGKKKGDMAILYSLSTHTALEEL